MGGTDARNWTAAGTQTTITITSLSLTDGGNYFISVRATNGAGLKSQVGNSDGIVVDLTPPSKPTVTDDGVYTTNSAQLHADMGCVQTLSPAYRNTNMPSGPPSAEPRPSRGQARGLRPRRP